METEEKGLSSPQEEVMQQNDSKSEQTDVVKTEQKSDLQEDNLIHQEVAEDESATQTAITKDADAANSVSINEGLQQTNQTELNPVEFKLRLEDVKRECLELREKNEKLQRSLDDALSEVVVAGCVKESLVELERQNAARIDEVATLQQLLNEATEEAGSTRTRFEHEFARLQAIINQLEHENKELKIQLKVLERGPGGDGGGLLGGSGVVDRESLLAFGDVTRSLARKVKSNFQNTVMLPTSPAHQAVSPVSGGEDDSMKRAHEDTELLKSIIVPLEEQIQALKDKLRQTDTLLREHESRQASAVLSAETLGRWLNGQTTDEAVKFLEDKSVDPQNTELYVSLLVARLALVTTELDTRRREHENIASELNKSRKTSAKWKSQAAASQAELLRDKQLHVKELSRMSSVLTEDQKLQLAKLSENDSPVAPVQSTEPDEEIVIQKEAWQSMEREVSRLRSAFGVDFNNEIVGSDAFRKIKVELQEMEKEKERLSDVEVKLRQEIQRESEARKEIESSWNEKAEVHKAETEALSAKIRELEGIIQDVTIKYNVFVKETRKELEPLINTRDKIVSELKRLQRENEKLVGLYETKSGEMQNETIDLPTKLDDMQLLLLKYREELIHAKIAKEHYEEKLKSEVNFVKAQLLGEQQSKESMEDQLTAEIEALREKVYILSSCQSELEVEQKRRREYSEHDQKQRQAYSKLQRQIEATELEKQKLETKIIEFKARVTNLQQELDNSVAVQNDFVRLSQSLQMELEKIRSQSTEVRWQHEDDVDECNSCKGGFHSGRSGTRRKGHCRHCGKIFCPDCLTKTVPSGPHRRPAKVCDVCHTLLVQHSAPYFSSEAPHFN